MPPLNMAQTLPGESGAGLWGLAGGTARVGKRRPQQVLGRVGGRAGRDRVSMGPVQLAQADTVEGNPGIMRSEL